MPRPAAARRRTDPAVPIAPTGPSQRTRPSKTADGANPRRRSRSRNRSRRAQPALDRADRPAEGLGRLPLRQPFQATEDDRRTKALGQPVDLLVQGRPEIIRRARDGALRPHLGRSLLVRPPAACGRPGAGRGTECDPMQPRAQRVPDAEPARLAEQDQECGLERVVDVLGVAEDPPTDAQHHRAVPLHQRREGRFAVVPAALREPLQ